MEFNTLTCVHAGNGDHPFEVYRFLRDDVHARFIQFIPIVVRDGEASVREEDPVTPESVTCAQYSDFPLPLQPGAERSKSSTSGCIVMSPASSSRHLTSLGLCVFDETCGEALVLEHNGDLYSCDHFVELSHRLGKIQETALAYLVASAQQRAFGFAKRDLLPAYCRECDVRFVCNDGCPRTVPRTRLATS